MKDVPYYLIDRSYYCISFKIDTHLLLRQRLGSNHCLLAFLDLTPTHDRGKRTTFLERAFGDDIDRLTPCHDTGSDIAEVVPQLRGVGQVYECGTCNSPLEVEL